MTLTSGTNIMKPSISDPDFALGSPIWQQANHWYTVVPNFFANLSRSIGFGALWLGQQVLSAAPAAVSEKTVAPFADLSLFRHVFELAVKPVDGTLLVKSRRYLMLEAGKGEAKIKYDPISIDEVKSLEEFYKGLTNAVSYIDQAMTKLFYKYEMLYKHAIKARINYEDFAKKIFKDGKGPDIINLVGIDDKEWMYKFKSLDVKGSFVDKPIINGKRLDTKEEQLSVFYSYAYEYGKVIEQVVDEFSKILKDLPENGINVFLIAAIAAYKVIVKLMCKDWLDKFMTPDGKFTSTFLNIEDEEGLFTDRNYQILHRRQAIALFLHQMSRSKMNIENCFFQIGFELSDIKDENLVDDNIWKNLIVSSVSGDGGNNGNKILTYLLDGLVEPIKKKFQNPFGVKMENKIWSEHKRGKILFSESDGSTLSFNGEGLHSETGSNLGNRDRLLKLLLSIN